MRPLFSFPHVVGLVMLLYAAGVMGTPHSGVTNYLTDNTFLTPLLIAGAFVTGGALILILRPAPALFSFLTTPILIYGVASLFYMLSTPAGALTAVVAHTGLWLSIQAALYDRARKGG